MAKKAKPKEERAPAAPAAGDPSADASLAFVPPDRSRFLNPFDDSALLGYYHEIAKWHGFVRFLGLPQLKDNPDVPIASLYVEPYLTARPVALDPHGAGGQEVADFPLDAVVRHPRLVVLGDPGAGKSTLVSWLALEATRALGGAFQERLGPLVPLPIVLRDLAFGSAPTWDDLLDGFLSTPLARDLTRERLDDLFERGQVFAILDGLDEVGKAEVRAALHGAVLDGARRYPSCRFLLTSRVVGYEQVPFHLGEPEPVFVESFQVDEMSSPWAEVLYVAPFSDAQIERFARNWYAAREASESLREQGVSDLLAAIHGSETTVALARSPILLALMALVHRVERTLPHGRVFLFEKIAAAYLETIDTFRGLRAELDVSLGKKKRWLAAVAFEMQRRRGEGAGAAEEAQILAREADVLAWLERAMRATGLDDPELPRRFLAYIGQRSGLLLPRGEGVFAFIHLAFQEYFAAWHLAETITTRSWLAGKGPPGLGRTDLARDANVAAYREVFVLLFELLAERGDWSEVLAEELFGDEFIRVREGADAVRPLALLLAEVASDPYNGWPKASLEQAWRACWRWELREQRVRPFGTGIAKLLFGGPDPGAGWPALLDVARGMSVTQLSLAGAQLGDLSPLAGIEELEVLDLSQSSFADLSSLSAPPRLKRVVLSIWHFQAGEALQGRGIRVDWHPFDPTLKILGHDL